MYHQKFMSSVHVLEKFTLLIRKLSNQLLNAITFHVIGRGLN